MGCTATGATTRVQAAEDDTWAQGPSLESGLTGTLVVLNKAEHFEEAERNCRRALELKPDYADAHNNLGNSIRGSGRLEEAGVLLKRSFGFAQDDSGGLGFSQHGLKPIPQASKSHGRAARAT